MEGPGSKSRGSVGPGDAGVFQVGTLACHSMWSVGPSLGVGQKDGSMLEFLADHPEVSSKPFMVLGGELGIVPGVLLAVHWLATRPRATLDISPMPCLVPFLSCLTTLLPPLLGGGPAVWVWPAAGVPQGCPGLGHKAGVSRPRAVPPVAGGGSPSAGLITSPADTHIHSQRGRLVQNPSRCHPRAELPRWAPSGDMGCLAGDYGIMNM